MNDITIRLGLDDTGLPQPVQRTNAAIASIGKTGEVSARQTAAAMRQLPAQFTDVATQLAGGANPLLVLLQQGGQIKDSFGGVGNALRGVAAAISPMTVAVGAAAAGVGLLVTAAVQGYREGNQLRDTIALTGNAAALTATRLQGLSEQVAANSQQTVSASRAIVLQLASTGQVSGQVLASQAQAVARLADVTGEDSKKIAGDFATMSGGVAKWAAEHNKAWNFITVEQYKHIRRVEEQQGAEKAMILVNQALIASLADQQRNLGTLETAWSKVKEVASGAWDAMLNVGREQTTRQQLDIAIDRLNALGGNLSPKAREAAEQRIQFLKETLKLENQQADARSRNAAANRKAIDEESKLNTPKPAQLGALQTAQEQYRQDFLRSEKAFYGELEKLRQAEREAAAKDPLGEFIEQTVLPAAERRNERRLESDRNYLQALLDANRRAGIELLEDEQQRGEALIAFDLDIARRRLAARGLEGEDRAAADAALDEYALQRRRQLEVELRKSSSQLAADTGREVYADTRNALAEAFREAGGNPLKAFGNALANTLYTRATSALLDAMATAAVGADGRGGYLGDLLSLLSGINGGGLTVDSGGSGIGAGRTDGGVGVPTRGGLATGTNYVPRNMAALVHEGEAIVPKRFNPWAGGSGGVLGGGMQITFAPQIRIDSRTDAEQIAGITFQSIRQAQAAMYEDLAARGLLRT